MVFSSNIYSNILHNKLFFQFRIFGLHYRRHCITFWQFETTNCHNATTPVMSQGGFRVDLPPKFSNFILYTNQNMFSSFLCCMRTCSGVTRFEKIISYRNMRKDWFWTFILFFPFFNVAEIFSMLVLESHLATLVSIVSVSIILIPVEQLCHSRPWVHVRKMAVFSVL